jgi:hypothetical protein
VTWQNFVLFNIINFALNFAWQAREAEGGGTPGIWEFNVVWGQWRNARVRRVR